MTGRRIVLTLLVAVLLALAVYGVRSTPEPRSLAEVGSAEQFVCALPQDVGGFLVDAEPDSPPPPRPQRGTVPDTFRPVTAVVCDIDLGESVAADGTATFRERHYQGDFGPAVKELNAPSARAALYSAACAGDYSLAAPVDMWLVDAEGRAVEPSYPLGECGFENTLGLTEVVKLRETESVQHEVRIAADGIVHFFSCSTAFKEPVPGSISLEAVPIFLYGFCHFDLSGPAPSFLGAQRYDDTSNELTESIQDLTPATPCTEQATSVASARSFGLVSGDGTPVDVVVELDGCRRLLADGYVPYRAPKELLDAIG